MKNERPVLHTCCGNNIKAKMATTIILSVVCIIIGLFFSTNKNTATLEEKTQKKTKLPSQSFLEFLNEEHSECVLSSTKESNTKINIKNGKYIYKPVQEEEGEMPLYDHESCFIMKARYNCAKDTKATTTTPPVATDLAYNYRYVWRNNSTTTDYCDIRDVFKEYSSITGKHILSSLPSNTYIFLSREFEIETSL